MHDTNKADQLDILIKAPPPLTRHQHLAAPPLGAPNAKPSRKSAAIFKDGILYRGRCNTSL